MYPARPDIKKEVGLGDKIKRNIELGLGAVKKQELLRAAAVK